MWSADRIPSSEGDDTIHGNCGDDVVQAGSGNDNVIGGIGDDIVADLLRRRCPEGGPDDDVISGGPGLDLLQGSRATTSSSPASTSPRSSVAPVTTSCTPATTQKMFGGAGDDSIEVVLS